MTLQGYQLACSRGERHLFTDLNFEIEGGDALRIAGTNGSGKTSLLRLLSGLTYPAAGEVRWNGENVRHARDEFCSELIYLGHANGVKDDLAAWENLTFNATLSGHPITSQQAWQALDLLGLDGSVICRPGRCRRDSASAWRWRGSGWKMRRDFGFWTSRLPLWIATRSASCAIGWGIIWAVADWWSIPPTRKLHSVPDACCSLIWARRRNAESAGLCNPP